MKITDLSVLVRRDNPMALAVWWTVALGAALGLWAFGSPVGSSPDEPAHMAMSWGLVTGQNVFDQPCDGIEPECNARIVEVPAGLIPSVSCHQFRADVPASCVEPNERVTAPTNALRYPPLFYGVVGGTMRAADGLGFGPEATGYAGRLAGALVTLSLLLPAALMASRRAPNVVYTIVAALTPMTMFLAGSINPNGVEIAGAIAAATALALAGREGSFRAGTGVLFVWGLLWLSWVRPLGLLWGGALLGFGALYLQPRALWHQKSFRAVLSQRTLWCASVVLVTSGGWFIYSLGARNTGASRGISVPADGPEQLVAVALRWGGMLRESLGILGWLDTRLPQLILLGLLALISSLVTVLITAEGDVARRRVVVVFTAAMIAGITLLMYRQRFLWQGRYAMPVMVAAGIWWSGTVGKARLPAAGRLASMLWIVTTASSLWVAARYSYGLEAGSRYEVPNLSSDAQWFGPLGSTGMVLLAFVATAGGLLALGSVARQRDEATTGSNATSSADSDEAAPDTITETADA